LYERLNKIEDTFQQFMQLSPQNQKNTNTSINNLQLQLGQLAKKMTNHKGGSFPTNTHVNPKEQCKAIVTRSGKEVGLNEKKN